LKLIKAREGSGDGMMQDSCAGEPFEFLIKRKGCVEPILDPDRGEQFI
jgi:hypothetical protein